MRFAPIPFCTILLFMGNAVAAPDAGQTLQQLQALPAPGSEPVPSGAGELPAPPPAEEAPAVARTLMLPVKRLKFTGNSRLTDEELASVVADVVGEGKPETDLLKLAERLTQHYRERGFTVARAYLPPQDIRDGVLEMAIVEGTLERIEIVNGASVSDERLRRTLASAIVEGEVVSNAALARGLTLTNELPGVGAATGTLKAGGRSGTTILAVEARPAPAFGGDVSLDNQGDRFTGEYRLSAKLVADSPLGLGDRLDGRLTVSDGELAYGSLGWDAPVGYSGLRAGLVADNSTYVLGGPFRNLDAHGDANSFGLKASYPWWLDASRQLRLSAQLMSRALHDVQGAVNLDSEKESLSARFDVDGSHAWPANNLAWRISLHAGSLKLKDPVMQLIDELTARTAGDYGKLVFALNDAHRLDRNWSLALSLNAQISDKNLDSSEKMSLGGAGGVRAYPQGEGSGDEAWTGTLEVRRRLSDQLQVTAFFDVGGVNFNHAPYAAGPRGEHVSGVGLGLAGGWNRLSASLNLAGRTGPVPQSDRDESLRAWAQAAWTF